MFGGITQALVVFGFSLVLSIPLQAFPVSPWGFTKTQSKIFSEKRTVPLSVHLEQDITKLLGARLKEKQWILGDEIKETPLLNTLCIEGHGKFEVELLRVQGNFGGTCRYPTMRISVSQEEKNIDKFISLFGAKDVYLSMPCWTIEQNTEQASDDLEEARAEHFKEFSDLKIQAKMGLPHLAVVGSTLHFKARNKGLNKVQTEWAYLLESANAVANRHHIKKGDYFEGKGKLLGVSQTALMAAAIQLNMLDDFELGYDKSNGRINLRNGFYFQSKNGSAFFTPFDHGLALKKHPKLWGLQIDELGVDGEDVETRRPFIKTKQIGCKIIDYLIENRPSWIVVEDKKYQFSKFREYQKDELFLLSTSLSFEVPKSQKYHSFMNLGLFYQAAYIYKQDYCVR